MIKGDKRITICEHTKKEVVQIYTDEGWLCLHNERPEDDAWEVKIFKQSGGKDGFSHGHNI